MLRYTLPVALGVCAVWADSAADFNALGVAAYIEKRWDAAIQQFGEAYELAKDNQTVRRNLCNAYQAQSNELARINDFQTATDLLTLAISVDPENASPLVQLGSYYLHLDMNSDAVYRLEEAVELDQSNLDAQELLGDAYYRQNDLASALAQWETVREIQPNRPSLQGKLQKAYREEGVEGGFNKYASTHFEISYKEGTNGVDLGKTLQILERAYREIGRKTGGVHPATPIQVVVYTAPDFAKSTQLGEHVGAVYDGKIRVPIRDSQGQMLPENELTRRLYHEYTHCVVRYWAGSNVPWWFNEGLAETFSSEMAAADTALLQEAQAQGLLFALASLEEAQLKKLGPDQLQLAYRQSHATVHYLWNRWGQRGLADMMEQLQNGASHEEALVSSYRTNYDLLQRDVTLSFGRMLSQR
ncbi:MAG: peptidase MA family metallohydrolase [Candidatus Hydrogenedentes bacterium]|nr:peptidase MA family metallohydrolase [Candidatus Hydrogenedentota bacterium]